MHQRPAPPLVFSLYERLSGRRPWTHMLRFHELQWRTREELDALALERLRSLLEHAVAHVPYYRDLFATAGLGPGDIREVADLSRLPTTSKADLRAGFPTRVTARQLVRRRGRRSHTSGSTGLPFEFLVDRTSEDRVLGSYLFFREWAHATLGTAVVYIAGPSFGARSMARSSAFGQAARRLLFGEHLVRLIGVELSPAELQQQVGRLPRGRGYFVLGPRTYLVRVAAALLETGLELPAYPRVVLSQAESLTRADASVIERAFRAPAVDHYSAYEALHLAQTCPDNPDLLHVNGERVILRIVRDDGSPAAVGEAGRVVLTDLWNEVMPFINYDIGDRAALAGLCPCGRGFPSLSGIEGRVSEVIRTPAGKTITPGTLGNFLVFGCDGVAYIWEYQAVQTDADAVILRIVPTPRFNVEFGRRVRDALGALLGPEMTVSIETVERIPAEPSGKRLIIKSALPPARTMH